MVADILPTPRSFTRFVSRNVKIHFTFQTLGDLDPDSVSSVRSVGITAGASTPKKIIEEVHTRMAEQSFAELLKEEEESNQTNTYRRDSYRSGHRSN